MGGEHDGRVVFELDTFWMLKVTERTCGRGGEVVLVRATHVRVRTKRKVRRFHLQSLRVE